MIVFYVRIRLAAGRRMQVVRSLSRMLGPTRANTGCVSCSLYADVEDDDVLLFAEKWEDEQSLIARLKSDSTRILLSAMEFASDKPEVCIETISGTKGMEFIAACRGNITPGS